MQISNVYIQENKLTKTHDVAAYFTRIIFYQKFQQFQIFELEILPKKYFTLPLFETG